MKKKEKEKVNFTNNYVYVKADGQKLRPCLRHLQEHDLFGIRMLLLSILLLLVKRIDHH
jgi:hypothetical protein